MKVLYISGPSFLDMDLSFVRALADKAECCYLMDFYPRLCQATALNAEQAPEQPGILPMALFPGMESFAPFLKAANCHVINRTSNNPLALSNLILQFKLYRFIKRLAPDVIHFNNQIYFTHFYLYAWARRLLVSIHDPFPHSGEEADAKKLSARVYQWLSNRFVIYHLLYNDMMVNAYAKDRGIRPERVLTSSLGPYEYLRNVDHETPSTPCDFLSFGRIQKYKGIDLLLEAFVQVLKEYPDATLTIAGSGAFWFDPSVYAIPQRNLRIINRYIPGDELAGLLESSRIVVCPYRDATQSGVVMSAYAFHRPVIVTNVGALSRTVEQGRSGLIVEPSNVEMLAEAMKQALSTRRPLEGAPEYIETMYHKGSKSWAAITDRILDVYKKVIGSAA